MIVPQPDGSGGAPQLARARLATMLDRLHSAGLLGSGMIGDPDPYTAAVNALELFRVDDVVISTLPDQRSGWMRANLIERVQHMTSAPVEHVVVDLQAAPAASGRRVEEPAMEAASIAHPAGATPRRQPTAATTTARRPRTPARAPSPPLLGMLLFIISEVMVFGAFFTAYFFIRIAQGDPWPAPGTELPVEVAGVNTAILVSSSFTIHWAERRSRKATASA